MMPRFAAMRRRNAAMFDIVLRNGSAVAQSLAHILRCDAGGGGGCVCGICVLHWCRAAFKALTLVHVPPPFAATQFPEALSEFRRHQIVQNGIDGRIQVEHDATEVQAIVVAFEAESLHHFIGHNDDPQCEYAKRNEAKEKGQNHRAKHEHHLLACLETQFRFAGTNLHHSAIFGNQVFRNDRVQHD